MDNGSEISPVCYITRLPYELRQRIFRYALQEKGTVGLQTPVWDNGSAFKQPLFTVCRTLRYETLETFYKSNLFLWHIHRPHNALARPDSDPSKYPLRAEACDNRMSPSLPWHYPRLMKDLRYLAVNIFLPFDDDREAWSITFPHELQSLVAALDEHGRKLKLLQITFITGYWGSARPLPASHTEALKILAQLRVVGTVHVNLRPSCGAAASSILSLGLEESIKV